MPIARGDKEYILPIKGLNSEANVLHFPQEFAVDVLNMEVSYKPQVVRPRKGLSASQLARLAETRNLSDHDIAISSFLWESVNADPTFNFVAVQIGRFLYFFDDTGLDDPTVSVHSERLDLNDALSGTSKGTLALLEPTRINYANIKGKLLICSEQIEPTLIQFDGTNLTTTALDLKIRDTLGIADGLEIDEHPATLIDDHKYNLLNQGWFKQRRLTAGSKVESDPIAEYNTQNSEFPSNSDLVFLGMVDATGDLIFDAEFLRDQTFGSTPAPRGHYVVDIFNIDRAAILADPSQSGNSGPGSNPGGGDGSGPGDGIGIPGGSLP